MPLSLFSEACISLANFESGMHPARKVQSGMHLARKYGRLSGMRFARIFKLSAPEAYRSSYLEACIWRANV